MFFLTYATFLKIVSSSGLACSSKILHSTTTETVSLLNTVGFKGQISEPMIQILTVKANTFCIIRSIAVGWLRSLNLPAHETKVVNVKRTFIYVEKYYKLLTINGCGSLKIKC